MNKYSKKCLTLFVCLLSLMGLTHCGSGGGAAILSIIFDSARALDGSDAVNTNRTFNIWKVNSNGTSASPLTNLTATNVSASDADGSPDGTKVSFDSNQALDGSDAINTNSTFNIWKVNANGTGLTPLTNLTAVGANNASPQWSPDGTQITYISRGALDGSDAANANTTSNIWVVNADGTGATPLTRLTADKANSFAPQWSPDGTHVAFLSSRALDGSDAANTNSTNNLWVVNADGTGAIPLTRLTANGASSGGFPQWSPDGTHIAFQSAQALDGSDAANTNGTFNIWVVNADGTGAKPLTNLTLAGNFVPQWSPDGTKIAFHSPRELDGSDAKNTNATNNIWVVNIDGTGATPLTNLTADKADSSDAQWSPNGAQITFQSQRALDGSDAANTNSTGNIWVMNADGSGATPVTNLTADTADSELSQFLP